jgi:hypothetical protein
MAAAKSIPELRATAGAPGSESPQVSYHATAFQYVGATALTVRGPISGKTYRFAKTGNSMVVDERDAPYFGAVDSLRRLPFVP